MKILLIILGLALSVTNVFGQVRPLASNDKSNYLYSKTDFTKIDSLELWNYSLDKTFRTTRKDLTKPIGCIAFWRTKLLFDSIRLIDSNLNWAPCISYEIFSLTDSTYCFDQSLKTRILSSCLPPDVGGDIFIIGKFIFLNRDICLDCKNYETGQDICRPIINQIISEIDKTKTKTLDEIVGQFRIKKGSTDKTKNACR